MSRGDLALIPFLMFLIAATRVYDPIGSMFANMAAVFACEVRIERMQEIENEKRMTGMTEYDPDGYDIRFEHVTFAYREKEDVLRDVSFTAKQGQVTALVGPSGGGKSTLCQLIPRFYDVTGGRVLVDGKDVRTLTQHSLRANIGIVQQDVFLFAGTIYDNIRYGRPDATEAEIVEAAKRAEIYDDILDMPDGFQTQVGERGAMLSGGQKQRVSIARIFLKNPPVLILDEATSALDSVTEARIQSAFDELAKGRTTLIIAHRLSTIRSASRILVIDGNGIQEEGTHEELMAKGGEYAQLYLAQKSVSV